MDLVEAMIVAGIGCRIGADLASIEAAIEAALRDARVERLDALAAPAIKRDEPAIGLAAARLGLPLLFMDAAALESAGDRCLTHSERVKALFNVPSMAEAAALAAAGSNSRLVRPRIATGHATCAIAVSEAAE